MVVCHLNFRWSCYLSYVRVILNASDMGNAVMSEFLLASRIKYTVSDQSYTGSRQEVQVCSESACIVTTVCVIL